MKQEMKKKQMTGQDELNLKQRKVKEMMNAEIENKP